MGDLNRVVSAPGMIFESRFVSQEVVERVIDSGEELRLPGLKPWVEQMQWLLAHQTPQRAFNLHDPVIIKTRIGHPTSYGEALKDLLLKHQAKGAHYVVADGIDSCTPSPVLDMFAKFTSARVSGQRRRR